MPTFEMSSGPKKIKLKNLYNSQRNDVLPQTSQRRSRYRFRARSYDAAILRYVGFYRMVTGHQILYRFFTYAGKGDRYGYRLLRRLTEQNLLKAEPLDPELGSVSRLVYTLTRDGWRALGLQPPAESRRTVPGYVREYRLQFADVMLERESEGWRLIPSNQSFMALQLWALGHYRDRLLNPTETVIRERLERLHPFDVGLRMIGHRTSGDLRLILPVRRGRSFKATIDQLPNLSIFPPITFEVVCSEPSLETPAVDYLQRWADRTRTQIRVRLLPHFRSRPSPADAPSEARTRYRDHGIGDPRTLI